MQNRVVFLDRDGVINEDSPDYIKNLNEFFFLPGSIAAICKLCTAGFDIIIITNQSGIGRKLIQPADLTAIHEHLVSQITNAGGCVKDIFFCPHHPEDKCSCRKPLPGLLIAAQKKHTIDLTKATMVGDSAKDIECARNAGVGKTILVETGNLQTALQTLARKRIQPDQILPDLLAASKWIIANER